MSDHFRMLPTNAERPGRRNDVLVIILFVVYLVLLTWIVLWKLAVPSTGAAAFLSRPIKLIPFLPSADAGASSPSEVVANVLLFVPFGIYLGLVASSWRWWKALAVFAGASLVLETTQHLISVGSFDITDVIVNTAGGLIGFGILALAHRKLNARTAAVFAKICAVGTVLALIAIGIFLALPLHYQPQQDFVVPRSSNQEVRMPPGDTRANQSHASAPLIPVLGASAHPGT